MCTGLGTIHVSATTAGLGAPPRPRIGEVYSTRSLSVLRTVKLPGGGTGGLAPFPTPSRLSGKEWLEALGFPRRRAGRSR